MANKIIVFVVLAVVLQASLISSSSSSSSSFLSKGRSLDLQTAREGSCSAWERLVGTVCRSIKDKSSSLNDGAAAYLRELLNGSIYFEKVAPRSSEDQFESHTAGITTLYEDVTNGVYGAIRTARECSDYAETSSAITKIREQLPYEGIVQEFWDLAQTSAPQTQALYTLKQLYWNFFIAIDNLAQRSCGEGELSPIDTHWASQAHADIAEFTDIVYGWLSKNE